jgi:hypothetical protein
MRKSQQIVIYSAADGKALLKIEPKGDYIFSLTEFTADGEAIVVADGPSEIALLDSRTGKRRGGSRIHPARLGTAFRFRPTGSYLRLGRRAG